MLYPLPSYIYFSRHLPVTIVPSISLLLRHTGSPSDQPQRALGHETIVDDHTLTTLQGGGGSRAWLFLVEEYDKR